MKILYDNKTGKVYARVKDSRWTDWAYYHTRTDENGKYWILKPDGSDNIHLPLELLDLTESEANRSLCRDVLSTKNKEDSEGNPKHYVDKGQIKERLGWKEQVEDEFVASRRLGKI